MNEMKLDRLFEEKLGNIEVSPSAQAWEKLNAGISQKQTKKSNKAIWFAVAASIVVVLVSGVILINLSSNDISSQKLISESATNETQELVSTSSEPKHEINQKGDSEIVVSATDNPSNQNMQTTADVVSIAQIGEEVLISDKMKDSPIEAIRENSDIETIDLDLSPYTFEIVTASINIDSRIDLLAVQDLDVSIESESKLKQAYEYAIRLKNGEENLIDLRKAKEDLFAKAKSFKLNNQSKPN